MFLREYLREYGAITLLSQSIAMRRVGCTERSEWRKNARTGRRKKQEEAKGSRATREREDSGLPASRPVVALNETLIKGREGGRNIAREDLRSLAINATVHPPLTAARFGNDLPSAGETKKERERESERARKKEREKERERESRQVITPALRNAMFVNARPVIRRRFDRADRLSRNR